MLPDEEQILKHKISFLGKINKLYSTLREENELLLQLKNLCNTNILPRGVLLEGKAAILESIEKYSKIKELDKNNEMRPNLGGK